MSRRTLPTTPHIGLSHVGHTLDEDLPRINDNYEKIDAQLAQAFEEREALRISTSEANTLLGQQVNEKLQAERIKNAEKNTKLVNTVNTAIKGITTKQEDFAIKIQQEEEEREKHLIELLASHTSLELEDSAHAFPKGKEGQMLTIKDGKLVFAYTYPLCEVKTWRHPTLKAGFVPAQGGVIEKAQERYPDAWEYLQTEEGQLLCVTEDEWQAMTKSVWATLADGTEVGWNGVGGAPFYVQDLDAGTLRVPDLRGMVAEAAGFDGLTAGGVHGDYIRNITGGKKLYEQPPSDITVSFTKNNPAKDLASRYTYTHKTRRQWYRGSLATGCYKQVPTTNYCGGLANGAVSESFITYRDSYGSDYMTTSFDASGSIPTGNANKPRAWGALVCVFLGTPQPISEAEHDASN